MAPLFLRRIETVVSLSQLAASSAAAADGVEPGTPGGGAPLEPDAPVAGIAGTRVATYFYAADAAPPQSKSAAAAVLASADGAQQQQQQQCAGASSDGDCSTAGGYDAMASGSCANGGCGSSDGAAAVNSGLRGEGVVAAAALHAAATAADDGDDEDEDDDNNNNAAAPTAASSDDEGSVIEGGARVPASTLLDAALLAMWEERAEQGLFRYDVTLCPTKVVPGSYGFVAQLNEGRYTKKRPTEFRVDTVVQPFDGSKFNFTKAFAREVLLAFEPAAAATAGGGGAAASSSSSSPQARTLRAAAKASSSPNAVFINVSPIEYGHVLLCPRVLDCTPQLLCAESALVALHFALEVGNPYLRVGFNSLGAFATINHLHFQAYYLTAPLPCERAPTAPLLCINSAGGGGGAGGGNAGGAAEGAHAKPSRPGAAPGAAGRVTVSVLLDYPVRGWVVEGSSLAAVAAVVGAAARAMQRHNLPHNVLIADCGARVFIFPQRYAERQARGDVADHLLEVGVNPAVWEISGHLVLKRRGDYERFTEAAAWELLAAVSLTERQLEDATAVVFGLGAAAQRAAVAAA